MKTILFLLCLVVCGMSIQIYTLKCQLNSLTEIVEKVNNTNVPRLTITGKYPYIEAKKGAIIIIDNKEKIKDENRNLD